MNQGSARKRAVALDGVAGLDHRAREVAAVRLAAGNGAPVVIGRDMAAHHRAACQRFQVVLGGVWIALNAASSRSAMSGHFRRVDAGQPDTMAAAAERVSVGDVGAIAGDGVFGWIRACPKRGMRDDRGKAH